MDSFVIVWNCDPQILQLAFFGSINVHSLKYIHIASYFPLSSLIILNTLYTVRSAYDITLFIPRISVSKINTKVEKSTTSFKF